LISPRRPGWARARLTLAREGGTRERHDPEISAVAEPLPTGITESRPELLKSKISAAEQALSLRLRHLAGTADAYEEQIALTAALKSLKVLRER
jgi:hypothetical protein